MLSSPDRDRPSSKPIRVFSWLWPNFKGPSLPPRAISPTFCLQGSSSSAVGSHVVRPRCVCSSRTPLSGGGGGHHYSITINIPTKFRTRARARSFLARLLARSLARPVGCGGRDGGNSSLSCYAIVRVDGGGVAWPGTTEDGGAIFHTRSTVARLGLAASFGCGLLRANLGPQRCSRGIKARATHHCTAPHRGIGSAA